MRTARIFKRIDLPQAWLLLCLWLTITQACLRWPTKKSKVPKHNVMLSNFRLLEQDWEEIINKNISIHFKLKRNVGPGLHRRLPRRLHQGCISCGPCSYPELTEDHVLPSAQVKIFRTVTRNAVNKSVWRKKDCFWLPLHKHAVNIWLSSLRIRARLSWRTGKQLHVVHVLRTYSSCSHPGW